MLVYAVTIFLSAFLLFQVQPLIAKFILPWFGGSAAVWSAALLFFQLVLLAGYFYAYIVIRYLKPKQQFWVHAGLLVISLATLPIIPSPVFKATGAADPTPRILLLLAATVGLPYTLLSATSPLLQAWFVRARHGAIPYRLFALSNFGSMLALLSYPTLVEPRMALHSQAVAWSWGFAAFAAVCVLAAWRSKDGIDPVHQPAATDAPAPTAPDKFLWIGLAACASILLLAVTSHLTQNVAPIPLLWVVPLSLYLLSFILCFESDRLYPRWLFLPLLAVALGVFTWGISLYERNVPIKRLIPALCGALFVCCMVCHGELSRRRPHPRYLTQFYLMVSVGGALGGFFVAFVSPRLFRDYLELPVAMVGCAALVTCVLWNRPSGEPRSLWIRAPLALATLAFAGYLGYTAVTKDRRYVRSVRNFYGVMHVRDDEADDYGVPAERVLVHGTIDHGTQLKEDTKGRITTSYFGFTTGINRAIRGLRETARRAALGDSGTRRRRHRHSRQGRRYAALLRDQLAGARRRLPPVRLPQGLPRAGRSLHGRRSPGARTDAQREPRLPGHGRVLERCRPHAPAHARSLPLVFEASEARRRAGRAHLQPLSGSEAGGGAGHGRNGLARPRHRRRWRGPALLHRDHLGDSFPDEKFFDTKFFESDSSSAIKPLLPKPGFQGWTDDFSNIITIIK